MTAFLRSHAQQAVRVTATLALALAVSAGLIVTAAQGPAPRTAPRPAPPRHPSRPNIVVILADDLGYGDVSAYNPAGRIATPNLDRLAREGLRFTDAHSGSSVCTPTRYGLLTGRYAWRSRLTRGVLWGNGGTLIELRRLTLASMLRARGYYTAAVGKWHLGLDWTPLTAAPVDRTTPNGPTEWIDYAATVGGGPMAAGFNEFFGIPASLDMRDYVYVENTRVVELPTARLPGNPAGTPGFYLPGRAAPTFRPERVLDDFVQRAVGVIQRRATSATPFFLYLPLAAPHTPMLPTGAFVGRTTLGPYGDFVTQTDAAIGTVLDALATAGVADRTLVIVASDNGPAPAAGISTLLALGHDAAGGWRGAKHGLYEGGHRVPFIVKWPGVVAPGTTTGRTITMTDVMRTLADVSGARLGPDAGEDSVSFLPVLRDAAYDGPLHEAIVMHSDAGAFAIRQGRWKLLLAPGSGAASEKDVVDDRPPVQLYDLETDPKETTNVQADHPAIVRRLTVILEDYQRTGRSM